MKSLQRSALMTLAMLSQMLGSVAAAEMAWYEDAPYSCAGPTALPSVLTAVGYRPSMSFEVSPNNTVYVAVQAAHVLSGDSLVSPYKVHSQALGAAQADALRDFFRRQSDTSLPTWADATLGFLVGVALPTGPSFAASAGYTLFDEKLKAASISAQMTVLLMAEGGQIERIVAPKWRHGSGLYLIVVDRYVTSVANEARSVALRSCLLPAKIEVTKFTTKGPTNNKEIRNLGSKWIQYDLEESKIDFEMIYAGQDEEFLYFTRQGNTRIRISTRGGPMQNERDGSWRTWYAKTDAI